MKTLNEAFGMTKTPFTNEIAINSIMMSEDETEALERLKYATKNNLFALLTSPPGCGKSTLLRRLREELDPRETLFIYISESRLTPRWLYNVILRQLGEREYLYRGDGKKAVHEKFAVIRQLQNKNIVVCVDEAHLITLDTIQELRFFLNCDMDSHNPVSLILSGQNELKDILRRSILEAVKQRISLKIELNTLSRPLTERYINTHLEYSGTDNTNIFTPEAIDDIYSFSKGVPRIINQICTNSLNAALSSGLKTIGSNIINAIATNEILM